MPNSQPSSRVRILITILASLFLPLSFTSYIPTAFAADPGTGTLSWTANTEPDLAGYDIFLGDQPGVYNHPNSPISVGIVSSFDFPPGMLLPGVTYSFALKAKDASNNLSGLSGEIHDGLPPDTTPPTVSITSPANNSQQSGNILVSANASDDAGIEHVQFFIDGVPSGSPDTSSPYQVSWDASGESGNHILTALARDNSGLETTSAAVTVTIAPALITNLNVASGKLYQVVKDGLQNGEQPYIDRSFTFTNIPAQILGATYIQTANNDKGATNNSFLTFNVTQPVTVYISRDTRNSNNPTWLNSFSPTGWTLQTSDASFDVFSKSYPAGQVVLGGNEGNSGSMYSVAIVKSSGPLNWLLTVNLQGQGSGSVTSNLGSINCPTTCGDSYVQDTVVTLTAHPANGSVFAGWNGGSCAGTNPCLLTMNQNHTVNATFDNEPPPPDTTLPTVNISTPSQNDVVTGLVTIAASASDNVGVEGVRFFVDDVELGGEDTTIPYSTTWDTTGLLANSYDLKAIARDGAGNETTSAIVTVAVAAPSPDNIFPTVNITTPSPASEVSGIVSINASASDNVGVVGVRFLIDNVLVGVEDLVAPYSTQWNTTSLPLGPYEVTAIARDAGGNETTSVMIPVTVIDPPSGPLTITNLSVASGKNYLIKVGSLHNGETVYIDRSYTFSNVPNAIEGTTFIQTANNDKNSTGNTFLQFTVDQPVTVYVGHDVRITNKPSWLNSFANTGMNLVTTDTTLRIYSQSFPAGPVVLGGNQGGGKSMYSVAVISNGPPPADTTPPTVSLTAPNEGDDVFGVVTLQATAADNIGVASVRFLVDDVQIGVEDTSGPYSTQWDTTPLIPGSFTLKAIARDAEGNETTSAPVNVTLIEPPTGGLDITGLNAQSGKTYEVQIDNLQTGERVYTDRSYTMNNVPGALVGATYIKTANNDKGSSGNSFLSFSVNQPVTVYVGHDNRVNPKPSWLNSFTATGTSLVTTDTTLNLYSKSFPAGTITLGGNQGAGKSMYSVIVTSP